MDPSPASNGAWTSAETRCLSSESSDVSQAPSIVYLGPDSHLEIPADLALMFRENFGPTARGFNVPLCLLTSEAVVLHATSPIRSMWTATSCTWQQELDRFHRLDRFMAPLEWAQASHSLRHLWLEVCLQMGVPEQQKRRLVGAYSAHLANILTQANGANWHVWREYDHRIRAEVFADRCVAKLLTIDNCVLASAEAACGARPGFTDDYGQHQGPFGRLLRLASSSLFSLVEEGRSYDAARLAMPGMPRTP